MGVLFQSLVKPHVQKQLKSGIKRIGKFVTNTDNNYRNMHKTHGSGNSVKNFATSTKHNYKNMGK